MKKTVLTILVLILIFSLTACGKQAVPQASIVPETSGEGPAPTPDAAEYHVNTADEFLAALGSHRTICIEAELIDFNTAGNYGKEGGDFYRWVDNFDGAGLVITGVEGLRIVGKDQRHTTLQATPRYADVLFFENCSDLTIANLTAGHLKEAPGSCLGNVLNFAVCKDVKIDRCGLFGCGVVGIVARGCDGLTVTDSEIYECSSFGVRLSDCSGADFTGCSIHDCGMNSLWLDNSSCSWGGRDLQNGENPV